MSYFLSAAEGDAAELLADELLEGDTLADSLSEGELLELELPPPEQAVRANNAALIVSPSVVLLKLRLCNALFMEILPLIIVVQAYLTIAI